MIKPGALMLFFLLQFGAEVRAQIVTGAVSMEQVTNKSIEFYNDQLYTEALSVLRTVKSGRERYPAWYYYAGLNLMGLGRFDEALDHFNAYISKSEISVTAKAYYYMGMIHFSGQEYEKALSSFELSLDVSSDPVMDSKTDAMIDKTIRYQNYAENSKKTNLGFLVGYNYDTDGINLSSGLFTENLNAHIFGYGASISRKVVDRTNFSFEPSFAILDSYTLDSSLKSNSTLQSTDALQFLISAPIRFYDEDEKLATRFDFSFNTYNVYLPISSSTRELALSSFFVKAQVLTPLSVNRSVKYTSVLAVDKSYGYTSDDDDASGLRAEFSASVTNYLAIDSSANWFYDLGIDYDSAKGVNTRYRKYSAAAGYSVPWKWATTSVVKLGYHYLNYPDKTTARTDNQGNLNWSVSRDLNKNSTLSFSLKAVSNSSDAELYRYTDYGAGVLYTYNIGY